MQRSFALVLALPFSALSITFESHLVTDVTELFVENLSRIDVTLIAYLHRPIHDVYNKAPQEGGYCIYVSVS